MSGTHEDRQHAPSPRRLEEARRRGDIPRSTELTAAGAYLGLAVAVMLAGGPVIDRMGSIGSGILAGSHRLTLDRGLNAALMPDMAVTLAPLLLLPMAGTLLAICSQRALVLAPEKLLPRMSRLSPLANARQKFGADGLMAFLVSTLKMGTVAIILTLFLLRRSDGLIGSSALPPAQSSALMGLLLRDFLMLTCALSAVFGAGDYLWQRFSHLRRNRMSRRDLTDEAKDSEGDPHLRNHRRQRAREIATNRMLLDVATADVVVVNPTHYAVALRWSRGMRSAPVCVAKGVDEIAARIRERAALAGVPVHSDPATARAIHASVDLGAQIRPEHYQAIAAAIRFAEAMRLRKKGGWR